MALTFDGASSYLNCGNVLDSTTNMTACAWVRRSVAGVRHEIFSKEGAANGWELSVLDSNVAEFGVFNGGFPATTGTTNIAVGTTFHVCGVRDATAGLLRIYINGVQEGTAAAGAAGTASGENFNIGRRPNASRYFNGAIEDPRVYNRALSADEVQTLYLSRGRDYMYNGLVGRWLFTEKAPATVLSSGGGTFQILNHQAVQSWGGTFTQIVTSYTIPSGLSNPVLVVLGGAEHSTFANAQPQSCMWGGATMTKHVGTNTTATFGSGSAIFTITVTAGSTQNITLTFPGSIGDGNTGGILHALVVEGGSSGINISTSGFNNAGNTSLSFTTTAVAKLGLTHLFTGDASATTGPAGTGHVLINEQIAPGGSSGFTSRIGYFNAPTIGSYAGYGFNFGAAPNRSAASMIALDLFQTAAEAVPDQSLSTYNATAAGALEYIENIGLL